MKDRIKEIDYLLYLKSELIRQTKKEIKEILDKWECYIGLTKKFTTNEYEMLRVEDVEKVLDYITNLQEENERLKELNVCVGCENNPDYKQRCKLAIEYIKKNYYEAVYKTKGTMENDLLTILQGDKNE